MDIDKDGWLSHKKITKEHRAKLEHGAIASIKAIVLHRTATAAAQPVLNAWKSKKEGTHFLISETGDIYQTASVKKQCWHVGKLYSRCRNATACSKEDAQAIEDMLHKKNISWGKKFKLVTKHELKKDYPIRFPHNHDSLGIEIVGVLSKDSEIYELPNKKQQESLFWLLDELIKKYNLSLTDIYAHGKIAHKDKNKSEGASALKAYSLKLAS